MAIKPSKFRHKVQQLSNGVQVVLPSKKNYLFIILCIVGLIMWTYAISGVVYITSLIMIGLGSNNGMWIVIGFPAFILVFLIGWGAYAIYLLLWQLTGKEIIIVENDVFRISYQIFNRSNFLEFAEQNISDLRVSTQQPVKFVLVNIYKIISGQSGMIAFEYGAKTVRFGFEIEREEAKQIVSILQESLSKSKAG